VLRRPALALAALLLAGLLGSSVFGSGGLVHLWRLSAERTTLGDEAFRLLAKNDDLRRRILGMRRSDRVLERLARQELGLVRDGEIVYRFRNRGESSTNPSY
jgi:cell division protein FtsB